MTAKEEKTVQEYREYLAAYQEILDSFDPTEDCCPEHILGIDPPEGFDQWLKARRTEL